MVLNGSEIPKEFSKVYPKYYAGELTRDDLFKMFNIKHTTFRKWIGELDLPIKTGRFEALVIPNNFESLYYKFLEDEISKPKLLKELSISDRTLYTWVKEKSLPLKKDYTKKCKSYATIVSVEPQIQEFPKEKLSFTLTLFGYELSFKARKKREKNFVSIENLPDFIEY